jgi:hypothetical protein
MTNFTTRRSLIATASMLALAGCGANDVVSPGTGGNVSIINNPAPVTPTPTATPTPAATLVTAATGCPTIADSQGLTDGGTITGPTGSYRVCALPKIIKRSITLPKLPGLLYQLAGRTDVGCDRGPNEQSVPATCYDGTTAVPNAVTLTIDPGVIVYANTGVAWLGVNRGNQIQAVGTATQPIIFTSRDNILGLNSDQSSGQWGGVVLLGRARVTDCAVSGATPGTNACYRQTEGAVDPSYYGGTTDTDNSGRVSFMQIRYSGYVLSADSELQSLTTEGIGSATQIDHVQSFNSSDDGAEFFGGTVNMKYFLSIGAEDDNLDTDTGLQGHFQYVLAAQRDGVGDSMIEADTDNAFQGNTPRQHTFVSNATFLPSRTNSSTNADLAAILLRGSTDYTLANSVVYSPLLPCLRVSQAQTASTTADATIDELGAPVFRSVAFQCGATKYLGANGVTNDQVAAIFGAGGNGNTDTYTNTLTAPVGGGRAYINGANETAVAAYDATAFNSVTGSALFPNSASATGFFAKTAYIGAFSGATDTWAQGWTCNSSTANFGTGNSGLCTSLPTT